MSCSSEVRRSLHDRGLESSFSNAYTRSTSSPPEAEVTHPASDGSPGSTASAQSPPLTNAASGEAEPAEASDSRWRAWLHAPRRATRTKREPTQRRDTALGWNRVRPWVIGQQRSSPVGLGAGC